MCGICGAVGGQGIDPDLLHQMTNSIAHRGPDDSGTYVGEGAALGFRRLSIIDLEGGQQPMSDPNELVWIVFNGEIYNYESLRLQLEARGCVFRTKSDTEVLLRLYLEFGHDCVAHCDGMFAFAIWDTRTRTLFASRDRLGEKPFYYWEHAGSLVFGSEIKAILMHPGFERRLDITALGNYLRCLYIPGEHTAFEGIRRLAPGHCLVFNADGIRTWKYWDLDFSRQEATDQRENATRVREALSKAVRSQMVSDVPVGAFLSGGLDSSAIVALMSEATDRKLSTFSIGFDAADELATNELEYARLVADRYQTDHHEVIVEPGQVLESLPQMAQAFDEPYAGALPQYFLAAFARTHVKVALSGVGADELFGDYGRPQIMSLFDTRNVKLLRHLPNALLDLVPRMAGLVDRSSGLSGISTRMSDIANRAALGVGGVFADYVDSEFHSTYNSGQQRSLLRTEVLKSLENERVYPQQVERLIQRSGATDPADALAYVDIKTRLVNEYLYASDTLSMVHGLEVRSPFLSRDFVSDVLSIPASDRTRPENSKSLLKRAVRDLLPEEILHRPKAGFSLPYGAWLRGELRPMLHDLLSPSRLRDRGLFREHYVARLIAEHCEGTANHTYRLWTLMMFELWCDHYQVSTNRGESWAP